MRDDTAYATALAAMRAERERERVEALAALQRAEAAQRAAAARSRRQRQAMLPAERAAGSARELAQVFVVDDDAVQCSRYDAM